MLLRPFCVEPENALSSRADFGCHDCKAVGAPGVTTLLFTRDMKHDISHCMTADILIAPKHYRPPI